MMRSYSISRRVQFAETDMAGVMHFANYFRWMEEVEHAFFRSLGMSIIQQHNGVTISFPRVRVSCEYFAAARFEDEIDVTLRLAKMGKKSVTWEAEFSRRGEPLARGEMKMVCCRMEADKFTSIPIPEAIRAKLKGENGT